MEQALTAGIEEGAPEEVLASFEANLVDKDPLVRRTSFDVLENDRRAIPILRRALGNEDWNICCAAVEALERFGWQPSFPSEQVVYFSVKRRWDKVVEFGASALPVLAKALRGEGRWAPDPEVVDALFTIDALSTDSIVTTTFRNETQKIRRRILSVLTRASHPATLPLLMKLVRFSEETDFSLHPSLRSDVGADPAEDLLAASPWGAILAIHPEWLDSPPQWAEWVRCRQGISWLPPVGGKIPLVFGEKEEDAPILAGAAAAILSKYLGRRLGKEMILLPPSWTAEEQVRELLDFQASGRLGREGYVHQLTVQGRLPDEFKYVAVALIIDNPHPQDWTEPFFDAPWGSVAPMIHDGLRTDEMLNPLWRFVHGRTDFLVRVAGVYNSEFPGEVERWKMERDRLLIEAKAYQRLALALHAAQGTAPQEIPEELRRKLADRWQLFKREMDRFLGEFLGNKRASKLMRVRWFLDRPRTVNAWPGPRFEANWRPVQKRLLALAEFSKPSAERQHLYNALRLNVYALLKRTADDIDRDLGLLPWPDVSSEAGLEQVFREVLYAGSKLDRAA